MKYIATAISNQVKPPAAAILAANASVLKPLPSNPLEEKNSPTKQQAPPAQIRLDKRAFDLTINLLGVCAPSNMLAKTMSILHKHVCAIPRFKCVVNVPFGQVTSGLAPKNDVVQAEEGEEEKNATNKMDKNEKQDIGNSKMILLNYELQIRGSEEEVPMLSKLSEPSTSFRSAIINLESISGLPESLVSMLHTLTVQGMKLMAHSTVFDYEYWTYDQVIKALLPDATGKGEYPGAFEQVGHLAHVNLRDEHLPYKYLIGHLLLEKHAGNKLKTVVNKTHTIDTTFRFFKMELLAGIDNYVVEVKEHGCYLKFDYSKVYFNSRLQAEHSRIIDAIQPGLVVCDMMAGVGPFAIPLGKKACTVYANDLNPHAFECINNNAARNKVGNFVTAFNMDGRDFINHLCNEISLHKAKPFHHVLMNLPAIAVEFLDVFKGIFTRHAAAGALFSEMPTINCYMFSKADDPETDAVQQVIRVIGFDLHSDSSLLVNVKNVRDVAPKKMMLCVSFKLPKQVAFAETFNANFISKRELENPEIELGPSKKVCQE